MKKIFKTSLLLFTFILMSFSPLTIFAESVDISDLENVKSIPCSQENLFDESTTYQTTNENGFLIKTPVVSQKEFQMGMLSTNIHYDSAKPITRHFSLTPHKHLIKNVKTQTAKKYFWYPSKIWVKNSQFKKESTWPTVSWTTSQSKTVETSLHLSVSVPKSLATTELGANFTKSHEISTSTERTFYVPYKKKGMIEVTYKRPYKTFTCETIYYYTNGNKVVPQSQTGSGNALGKPYNINCDLKTISI